VLFGGRRQLSYAFAIVHTLMQVLKQCGDDLARANVMRQVVSLHDAVVPMLLLGISIKTSLDTVRADQPGADGAL
jgi:hypothetical protein